MVLHGYQMVLHGYQMVKFMFGFLFKHFTQLSMVILFYVCLSFQTCYSNLSMFLGVAFHMFYIGKS